MIRGILQNHASGEHVFPETEALLFAASRAQLVRAVILPALARGACVICDRFADSTTAYQGFGRGFGLDRILAINDFAANGAVPDVTVLLDIDVSKGFARLRGRNRRARTGPDRFEQEDRAFHETVRAGYLEMAGRWPERIRRVDADRDEGAVHAAVWSIVQGILTRNET
jgi:dTMP kinase